MPITGKASGIFSYSNYFDVTRVKEPQLHCEYFEETINKGVKKGINTGTISLTAWIFNHWEDRSVSGNGTFSNGMAYATPNDFS